MGSTSTDSCFPCRRKTSRPTAACGQSRQGLAASTAPSSTASASADDVKVKGAASFPAQRKAKKGETVFFSWIVYKSRAHRDSVNKKVMKDPRIAAMMPDKMPMPFDDKRMRYGGFKTVVEA